MDVGMMMVFASYGWEDCSDTGSGTRRSAWRGSPPIFGFDCLWSAEHHFNDYSFVPDNIQLDDLPDGACVRTSMSARRPSSCPGTIRCASPRMRPCSTCCARASFRFGMGRGLARREFAAFRLSMDESRGRFDEAAPMIIERAQDRLHRGRRPVLQAAAHRDPPAAAAFLRRAHLRRRLQRGLSQFRRQARRAHGDVRRPALGNAAPVIESGRELHRKYHGTEPPLVMLTEFCVCGTDLAETEEEARKYQGKFVESNFHHYEFLGEHFKTVKGYDAYQQKAEIARKAGLEGAVHGFMQAASWGTPDKILRGLEERRELSAISS